MLCFGDLGTRWSLLSAVRWHQPREGRGEILRWNKRNGGMARYCNYFCIYLFFSLLFLRLI